MHVSSSHSHAVLSVALLLCFLTGSEIGAQTDMRGERMTRRAEAEPFPGQPEHNWFYATLEVNYVVLNALDLVTTFESLEAGAREANPVARLYIENKPLAVLIKGGMTAGTLMALRYVRKRKPAGAYLTLGVLNLFYGVVVTNNIGVYLEVRR